MIQEPRPRAAEHGVPEHPRSVPLTTQRWRALRPGFAAHQPALAELSLASLWLWRGGDEIRLSRIGDAVVVHLTDRGGQLMVVAPPQARFTPGAHRALVHLVAEQPLRFVSAPTARALTPALAAAGARFVAERDEADYVYAMAALAAMPGSRGREADRFARRHEPVLRAGTLGEAWAQEHLLRAFDRWLATKYGSAAAAPAEIRQERAGVAACCGDPEAAGLRVFAVSAGGAPVAVSLVEPMWGGTWMGVVLKADPTCRGAVAWLRREVARAGLHELGAGALLNVQQDEGLPGLRAAKQSYRPLRLEPKFAVVPRRAPQRPRA